jgi:hypothetical protein
VGKGRRGWEESVGWVGEKNQESSYEGGWKKGKSVARWWEAEEKEK